MSREREKKEKFYFFIEFDGSISCVPNTFIGLRSTMEHISIYLSRCCWDEKRDNGDKKRGKRMERKFSDKNESW